MSAARSRHFRFGWMAATVMAASMLATPALAYTDDEQSACTGDAFRLCSSEIPDVDRITACMVEKKAQLSPGCRAFFNSEPQPELTPAEAPAASVKPVRKRVSIHAIKSRKKRKLIKSDDAS